MEDFISECIKYDMCRKCGTRISDKKDNWSIEDNVCSECSKF